MPSPYKWAEQLPGVGAGLLYLHPRPPQRRASGTSFSIPLRLSVATHSIRRMQGNDNVRPGRALAWGELDCALWGKSDGLPPGVVYAAIGHLLDTAAVAWCAWDLYLTERQRSMLVSGMGLRSGDVEDRERVRRLLACWAGWHDLGKIGAFQRKDDAAFARLAGYPALGLDTSLSHGEVTQLFLASSLPGTGYDAEGTVCRQRRRPDGWPSCWAGITAGTSLSPRGAPCARHPS